MAYAYVSVFTHIRIAALTADDRNKGLCSAMEVPGGAQVSIAVKPRCGK
jgi:hypothetical protein